jgi:hypothetical protein
MGWWNRRRRSVEESRADSDPLGTDGSASRLKTRPLTVTMAAGLAIGLLLSIIHSVQVPSSWTVLASSTMFGMASLATGGLLGLLFGVPRTREGLPSGAPPETSVSSTLQAGVGANTNLEQISDWLTKIIVGVTLTQLGTIKSGAMRLFDSMAPSLGGADDGAAFAGAIVIYFSVLGFFAGWLYARLRLGVAMSNADALLDLARRAERAGDPTTAHAAREAAAATVANVTGGSADQTGLSVDDEIKALASRYEELRATLNPSPSRTAQLANVVEQAKKLCRRAPLSPDDVRRTFEIGTEGRRIVALAFMGADSSLADPQSVLVAIRSSLSAFEQYHALTVANLVAPTLPPEDRAALLKALEDEQVLQRVGQDSSRLRLINSLRRRLSSEQSQGRTTPPT